MAEINQPENIFEPKLNLNTETQTTEPKQEKEVKDVPVNTQVEPTAKPVIPEDPLGQFDYSNCKAYTVKKGETLFDVAQKYAIALQQLRYFNHIDKATLKVRTGQVIYIPNEPVYVPEGA